MRKSLTTNTFRKRAGVAAAGVAAVAAFAVPGVAWANNAISLDGPVAQSAPPTLEGGAPAPAAEGTAYDSKACSTTTLKLSDEGVQRMLADGSVVKASVHADPSEASLDTASGAKPTDPIHVPNGTDGQPVLNLEHDASVPAGAITVTRNC